MLVFSKFSHFDHDLPFGILSYLLNKFRDTNEFSITTYDFGAGEFPCALVGPITGFPSVKETEVFYLKRGIREYESRCVDSSKYQVKNTSLITVIAGPYQDIPCMLYTAFPGPLAPKEVFDPKLSLDEREHSIKFWSEHALAARKPENK